jgi:hypothetical protein
VTTTPGVATALSGLLPAAVRLLAAAGAEAVADVLHLCAQALDCDELVLRDAGGARAVGRAQSRAVPPQRETADRWTIDAPVRRRGEVLAVLTATAGRPFTADSAAALTAVADMLALALAASAREAHDIGTRRQAGQAVLDAEADRAQLAASLDNRVARDLVALHYTAERVREGSAEAIALREPARAALAAYRMAQRDVRSHALQAGLRVALAELAGRVAADRPDDGQPALRVEVTAADPRLDQLPPPIAVAVERVAEAVLWGATGQASLHAAVEGRAVKLRADCADIAYDASELDRWNRRVSALGGLLRVDSEGVELVLPAATEGSHDDGPDL